VSFFLSGIVWLLLYLFAKGAEPYHPEEIVSGLSVLGFLCLGYMEMMFKICRGFSHTLVTDIYRMQSATWQQVTSQFAEGVGMDEMLRRRIATMEEGGLFTVTGNIMKLTPRGAVIGNLTLRFKSFLRLGAGG